MSDEARSGQRKPEVTMHPEDHHGFIAWGGGQSKPTKQRREHSGQAGVSSSDDGKQFRAWQGCQSMARMSKVH
jgi:hypothetical protein